MALHDPPLSPEKLETALAEAAAALRSGCPEDLPKVEYPWGKFWPSQDAPEFMWRAFSKWNSFANRWVRREIDDPEFRALQRTEFSSPLDEQFIRWWADVFHDGLVRETLGSLRVMLLVAALKLDDPKGIAMTLGDVLDRAGKGNPTWARAEAAWRGIRTVSEKAKSSAPVDDIIAYLRGHVAFDAKSREKRYGVERPNDSIRVSDAELAGENLTRISAEALADLPSLSDTADIQIALAEEQARLEQFRDAVIDLLRPDELELVDLIRNEDLSISEAERRLDLSPGTWRNLRKRALRKLDNPDT